MISHSIKLPFGPNGAIGVHIGDDLHIVTLSKGKKIGVDKLKSVAELMRNRAEGFIAGYRDRMESGLGGKQPEVSEEYRSVKHDTEWKSSYGEGWWLATMESDW